MTEDTADKLAELDRLKRRHNRNLRAAHAKGLLEGVCSMLGPGDLVIDCGANVGDITVPLAQTGADVIAFEPDPWAFPRLQEKVSTYPNVTLHNAAVGIGEGTVKLRRALSRDRNPKGASVKSTIVEGGRGIGVDDADSVAIPLLDFPRFLNGLIAERGGIAFLKMDIEGAELDILEAMSADRLFDHIRLTLAETHERKFKALRPRFRELRRVVAGSWPSTRVNLDWV